jgi:hypothetical protein
MTEDNTNIVSENTETKEQDQRVKNFAAYGGF